MWAELSVDARDAALARPPGRSDPALQSAVRGIVDDVRAGGWDALCAHAERLDGAAPRLVPVADSAARARAMLSSEQVAAMELARRNVEAFHAGSLPSDHLVETMPGLTVRKTWRAIDRVGLYVPGGKTPLFSTLMMLAIPARAAGVGEIVVVTPPNVEGGLDPVIALAAELCGIEVVWTVGGAQAIAALAFGSGGIPRVAKICGPGNAWVAEAKSYCASLPGGPAIDMPAGPSELMVIADECADFDFVAKDLLSQAEHDPSAQVLLVTTSPSLLPNIENAFRHFTRFNPRAKIVEASLAHARAIVVNDLEDAVAIANDYAPEHLSLAVDDPDALVPAIRNAGAVFAGHWAAETFGDYLAGSSHILPTDGAARAWSGIGVQSFLKAMTVQHVTEEAARAIAYPACRLALMEGLHAHADAAAARSEDGY